MAKSAAEGVARRGGKVKYLRIHPEDWEIIVAYYARVHGQPDHKPALTLLGHKAKLSELQTRGDVMARSGPVVV